MLLQTGVYISPRIQAHHEDPGITPPGRESCAIAETLQKGIQVAVLLPKRGSLQLGAKDSGVKPKQLLVLPDIIGIPTTVDGLEQHIVGDAPPLPVKRAHLFRVLAGDSHSNPHDGPVPGGMGEEGENPLLDFLVRTGYAPNLLMRPGRCPVDADGDAGGAAPGQFSRILLQQQTVGAHVNRHSVPGEDLDKGKNILPQKRFPAGDAHQVDPHPAKIFGESGIFSEGHLPPAAILPALAHPAAAIAPVGDIKLGHVRAGRGGETASCEKDILPGTTERGKKAFREYDPAIDPKIIELQICVPLLFIKMSGDPRARKKRALSGPGRRNRGIPGS